MRGLNVWIIVIFSLRIGVRDAFISDIVTLMLFVRTGVPWADLADTVLGNMPAVVKMWSCLSLVAAARKLRPAVMAQIWIPRGKFKVHSELG